jgi:hypothetical protein|tara:strand:+ start:513 stop:650 length:138 start_codon:yes stop_codon:yes gene_type:complete
VAVAVRILETQLKVLAVQVVAVQDQTVRRLELQELLIRAVEEVEA